MQTKVRAVGVGAIFGAMICGFVTFVTAHLYLDFPLFPKFPIPQEKGMYVAIIGGVTFFGVGIGSIVGAIAGTQYDEDQPGEIDSWADLFIRLFH